jgi:hypothetical protein
MISIYSRERNRFMTNIAWIVLSTGAKSTLSSSICLLGLGNNESHSLANLFYTSTMIILGSKKDSDFLHFWITIFLYIGCVVPRCIGVFSVKSQQLSERTRVWLLVNYFGRRSCQLGAGVVNFLVSTLDRFGEVTASPVIRLKRIYNFWCSMLVFTPFAYCFVTLRGTFMHFPELTY